LPISVLSVGILKLWRKSLLGPTSDLTEKPGQRIGAVRRLDGFLDVVCAIAAQIPRINVHAYSEYAFQHQRRLIEVKSARLQIVALVLFLPFDGLVPLYVISALFGLFQGGIVPSYAIIVREYFSPREAGVRVATVLTASVFGMALGGWMSGAIFDWTGSYHAAFINGIAWNLLNVAIVVWLLRRPEHQLAHV
jgi:MFS family permease